MFEFVAVVFITVGLIEEVIVPVGSQAVDTATWAVDQAAVRVEQFMD